METHLKRWRRRCAEGWLAGVEPQVLCDLYAAFGDERERHTGPLRVQLADAHPAHQLAGLFAAWADGDPLDVFVTPGHGLPAEMEAYEAAVAADFFWSGGELVSCGRVREARVGLEGTRVFLASGGSTGGLKFAAHTFATLECAALGLQAWLGGGPIDSVCLLPLHHVSGLMQAVRAYTTGGCLTLWEWPRAVRGEFPASGLRPAVVSLVPTQLARLLETPGGADWLRGFRCVFLGGAALWPELAERARVLQLPLAPCYGMTETAAQVAALRPEEFLAGVAGVGAALPHARVEIINECGAVLGPEVEGRVRVRGGSVCLGYHPGAASASAGVFDSSDRGVLDASGRLTVLGRLDALINTGGEKVDPGEVEAALRALGVGDAAVIGLPHGRWGEVVVALVAGCVHDDATLHARLRERLAAPKTPKHFVRLERLPRNGAGKLDGRRLRELAERALREGGSTEGRV